VPQGLKVDAMKKFMIIILLNLLIASHAVSAQSTLQAACEKISREERFVARLYDDNRQHAAQVCSYAAFSESGNDCDDLGVWSNSHYTIVDLNEDEFFDIIFRHFSGGLWTGERYFLVLANCGDDTFIKLLEEGFATLNVDNSSKNSSFHDLRATRQYAKPPFGGGYEDFDIQDVVLKFNHETLSYHIDRESKVRKMAETDEDAKATLSNFKDKLNIDWNEFPASIPRPKIIEDGLKEYCENLPPHNLPPHRNLYDRLYKDGQSILCVYNKMNGSCVGKDLLSLPTYKYSDIAWGSPYVKSGTLYRLYRWYGRFLNRESKTDFITIDDAEDGMNSVFSIYASCPAPGYNEGRGYLKVLQGTFASLTTETPNEQVLWAPIQVTRKCRDKNTSKVQVRSFTILFDKNQFEYGPPNGDLELLVPCSPKEMSMPFDLQENM
jgi:hypothetical protein